MFFVLPSINIMKFIFNTAKYNEKISLTKMNRTKMHTYVCMYFPNRTISWTNQYTKKNVSPHFRLIFHGR